jgi:hypothetical protein
MLPAKDLSCTFRKRVDNLHSEAITMLICNNNKQFVSFIFYRIWKIVIIAVKYTVTIIYLEIHKNLVDSYLDFCQTLDRVIRRR